MMKTYSDHDVLPATVAYLTDRATVNHKQEQAYDAQWHRDEDGLPVPRPITDTKLLEERRRIMGLEPFTT